ncbi:dual specificity phosphatase [Kalaharituber pfeilii]|nr:dual specificity phosphatase [Kalaharituber pfeilii]
MKFHQADSTSLKRTYTLVSDSYPTSLVTGFGDPSVGLRPRRVAVLTSPKRHMSISLKRPFPFSSSPLSSSFTPDCTSTVETEASVPSLPRTGDIVMSGCQQATTQFQSFTQNNSTTLPAMTNNSAGLLSYQQPHNSHSTSTSASSSNNSSPTSTISTTESSVTETDTLNSNFDSPTTSKLPLSDFASKNMGRLSKEELTIVPPTTTSASCPQTISPSKKARNAKNLSLNVPPPTGVPRAQPTGIDPSLQGVSPRSMSAPNSPAFILPPPPPAPKRRPSNLGLTIKLPSTLGQTSNVQAVGKSGLRHHQSSPSLFSPGPNALPGGMKFPPVHQSRFYHPLRPFVPDSIPSSIPSSVSSPSPPRTPPPPLHEMDEEFEDEPRSGEAKSPAYPEGPVCIFDPNVYLFAEPDAELASEFDVVINVAREVLNPFDLREKRLDAERLKQDQGVNRRESVVPDTGCTDASFITAFEETPFSPTKTPVPDLTEKKPEYIHMPWDHNTPIVDELPPLVKLIRDRVTAGKKVLVHCQCGVSRSASLLIAYALFMKPEQTVQEAYDTVKNRSKWIGPNMSLIFQLLEWKKRLGKEDMGQPGFRSGMGKQSTTPNNNFGRKGRNPNGSLSVDNEDLEDIPEPLTAPLPQRPQPSTPLKPPTTKNHPIPQMVRTRSENGGLLSDVMPGPSSAPPGMITIPHKGFPQTPEPVNDAPHAFSLPSQSKESAVAYAIKMEQDKRRIAPIRPETEKRRLGFGLPDHEDSGPEPSFRSPRNSGYFGFGLPLRREVPAYVFEDPRSPNRGAETPVLRSIFDVFTKLWRRLVG